MSNRIGLPCDPGILHNLLKQSSRFLYSSLVYEPEAQRDRHRVVLVFPPIWPVTGPNLRALHSPRLEWILCQETPGPDTTHVAYLNASGDQNWDSSQNHAASSDSHPPSAVLVLLNLLSILNDVGQKTSYLYSGLLEICFSKVSHMFW